MKMTLWERLMVWWCSKVGHSVERDDIGVDTCRNCRRLISTPYSREAALYDGHQHVWIDTDVPDMSALDWEMKCMICDRPERDRYGHYIGDHAPLGKCRRPPAGWYCTRSAGHDGPCAAIPDGTA